jgi:glycosyltransferase involved in cell wall biosynthesis
VVWNGPVLARVDRARARAAVTPPDLPGLPGEGEHLVVWVGKMGVQDRVELVVEVAAAVVSAGRRDVRFVLVGDGERLGDLRADVRRRGLDPWVTFAGWVAEDAVFGYLAAADVGLDTSLQEEVTPVKALEYLAFGVPLAAFDLPETRRLAAGAAVLVSPGDVQELARAVTGLMDDRDRRRSLGSAGRRRVAESLSWEAQEASYLAAVGPPWVSAQA